MNRWRAVCEATSAAAVIMAATLDATGRILLVDDEPSIRSALSRSMARFGFEIDVAESEHEAMARAQAQRYAVFIVDLNLDPSRAAEPQRAVGEGIAIIEKLRKLQLDAACLLITGELHLDLPTDRPGVQAISDIIHKPWDEDALALTLRRALRLNRGRQVGRNNQQSASVVSVLLVEDNPGDADLVLEYLGTADAAHYDVVTVGRLASALKELQARNFDVALVDLSLPDAMGLDTVTSIQLAAPTLPVIVLTGRDDEAVSLQAVEIGAQDYLTKGHVDGQSLARAIRYAIERKGSQERLAYLAHYDQLTGLPNRTLFRKRLARLMSLADRGKDNIALLLLDLDGFKDINDTLGHDAGDTLLRRVGERLLAAARDSDTVARLGGDEFAVIVSQVERPAEAATVAERIIAALASPLNFAGRALFATASVGIALYPSDGRDIEELLRCADLAMYRAKERGRNTFQYFDQVLTARAATRQALVDDLRRAVAQSEFRLVYQPQFDLQSGSVVGVEALLRWRRGDRDEAPEKFIPLLEESGMILPVGEWVIHEACTQQRRWRDAGLHCPRVAVNISARQFRRDDLADTIGRVLADTRVPAEQLELELTESLLMADSAASAEMLCQLRQMGMRLAIDDFGTGYSSLAYLKRFAVDAMKIDRSFVRDIPHSAEDGAIASAVIALGRSLHLTVTAEGVETDTQARFLATQGCDHAQGFHLAVPLESEACAELLRGNSARAQGAVPPERRALD